MNPTTTSPRRRPDWRGAGDRRRNSVREPNEHSNVACFIAGVLLTSIAWWFAMGGGL